MDLEMSRSKKTEGFIIFTMKTSPRQRYKTKPNCLRVWVWTPVWLVRLFEFLNGTNPTLLRLHHQSTKCFYLPQTAPLKLLIKSYLRAFPSSRWLMSTTSSFSTKKNSQNLKTILVLWVLSRTLRWLTRALVRVFTANISKSVSCCLGSERAGISKADWTYPD